LNNCAITNNGNPILAWISGTVAQDFFHGSTLYRAQILRLKWFSLLFRICKFFQIFRGFPAIGYCTAGIQYSCCSLQWWLWIPAVNVFKSWKKNYFWENTQKTIAQCCLINSGDLNPRCSLWRLVWIYAL
jgi:hypothetical protein